MAVDKGWAESCILRSSAEQSCPDSESDTNCDDMAHGPHPLGISGYLEEEFITWTTQIEVSTLPSICINVKSATFTFSSSTSLDI